MPEDNEQIQPTPDHRFKARIVIFNVLDHGSVISNYSVNMSTGGVFIETVNLLPIDTALIIQFKIPDGETIITCKAKVAWLNEPGHLRKFSLPPGMGLQFLDLSLEDMHLVRDYLNSGDLEPSW